MVISPIFSKLELLRLYVAAVYRVLFAPNAKVSGFVGRSAAKPHKIRWTAGLFCLFIQLFFHFCIFLIFLSTAYKPFSHFYLLFFSFSLSLIKFFRFIVKSPNCVYSFTITVSPPTLSLLSTFIISISKIVALFFCKDKSGMLSVTLFSPAL